MNTIFKILVDSLLCTILVIMGVGIFKTHYSSNPSYGKINLSLSENQKNFHEMIKHFKAGELETK